MKIRGFFPNYAPDNEGGAQVDQEVDENVEVDGQEGGADDGGQGDGDGQQQHDGPGSGRSAIRKSLESGFEKQRKQEERAATRDKKSGRFQAARQRQGATDGAEPLEGEQQEGDGQQQQQQQQIAPPAGISKEAAAEWTKTPPAVQQAFLKRVEDMDKGVAQLKNSYAEIDKALSPHLEAIRRHGHTPAQAVNQLFSWFQAIAGNPGKAFPALAKSFNYDWNKIKALPAYGEEAQQGQQQQGQQQSGNQPPGDIPEPVQAYINQLNERLAMMGNQLEQRFGSIEQGFQRQQEAQTEEVLAAWSKDKPHFEAVRHTMGQLIASGTVPLKDGKVDLDGAYEMAVYAIPDVRAKVLAEQEAAKVAAAKKAAEDAAKRKQAEADKARKAGASINGGTPGSAVAQQPGRKVPGQRKSVRESLAEAIQQVREEA